MLCPAQIFFHIYPILSLSFLVLFPVIPNPKAINVFDFLKMPRTGTQYTVGVHQPYYNVHSNSQQPVRRFDRIRR